MQVKFNSHAYVSTLGNRLPPVQAFTILNAKSYYQVYWNTFSKDTLGKAHSAAEVSHLRWQICSHVCNMHSMQNAVRFSFRIHFTQALMKMALTVQIITNFQIKCLHCRGP